MPLATSGTMNIGGSTENRSINLEFGRTASQQTSMSQLYRGGSIVPNITDNAAIPTSGGISLSNFYGATARLTRTITISSNQTNYVANTAKVSDYVAGITDVTFVINSGIYLSGNATDTNTYALDIDTSWAAGDTVTITNNGFIVGRGGNGANGTGGNGLPGGRALRAQRAVTIQNDGTVGSGGGGGGSGARRSSIGSTLIIGGGGGGGWSSLTNSSGGSRTSGNAAYGGANGTGGTATARGSAGSGGFLSDPYGTTAGGAGGAAGTRGANGSAGTTGSGGSVSQAATSGGAAGTAVVGNSFITWTETGTRLGAIT
jgi:hypothetical protein